MPTRWLVLALLLAPLLLFGAQRWRQTAGTEPLLPPFAAGDVARVELAGGRDQVVLARRMDTGQWEILSAADAPGDAARIEAMIDKLAALRGTPVAPGTPVPRREPLEARLLDSRGEVLAHAAFWPGEARRQPAGPRLALPASPALPLWPSAWSSLKPPRIAVERIAQAERLTPEGAVALDTDATVELATLLRDLSAKDFVPGSSVDWMGARHVRVRLTDGSAIDLQQVPDGEGRYFLRLASDTLTEVRAARIYAFRVAKPLP